MGMAMNGYILYDGRRANDDNLLEMVALWLLIPLKSITGLFQA